METDSRDALIQIALGHEFSQKQRFDEAEHCFLKALSLDPNLPMAHNNLGWVRQMQGDYDRAIKSYKKALNLEDSLAVAQWNLANLLSHVGRFQESISLWDELARVHSDDQDLLNQIIDTALGAGEVEVASKYAQTG